MVCQAEVSEAAPMGTAWTYQGRLIDANSAADGLYDFQFKLFDDPCTGSPIAGPVNEPNLNIIDGYFTAELDFGSGVFDGDSHWLEVGVRPGDSNGVYTKLSPRTELTPVPYALQTRGIFVDDAGNVGIGTTTPGAKLEAVGSVMVSGTVDGVDVSNHAANTNAHHTPPTTLPPSGLAGGDLSGSYPNPSVLNDSHTHGDSMVSDNISINNTRLYAPAGAGNVGIGTTEPNSALDVNGTVTATANTAYAVYGKNSDSENAGSLGGSDYGVKSEGDLVVEPETAAYRGNIGPNGGAPFPRPAYDSGWILGVGEEHYVTLHHGIGGNVDNYVVRCEYKYFNQEEQKWSYWASGYRNLTTSSVESFVSESGWFRVRIWVYN